MGRKLIIVPFSAIILINENPSHQSQQKINFGNLKNFNKNIFSSNYQLTYPSFDQTIVI